MEEREEYSVFNETPRPKPPRPGNRYQRYLYFVFAGYFFIQGLLRWIYFIAFRKQAIATGQDTLNTTTIPYLISAVSISLILTVSIVLFIRRSMRASIGLLIFGAVLELLIFYFIRPN